MYSKQTILVNACGLHARPAAQFVKLAKDFSSKITVRNVKPDSVPGNAKSMIMVLSQALCQGSTVEICAEGADEKEAVDLLIALIDSGFGEE